MITQPLDHIRATHQASHVVVCRHFQYVVHSCSLADFRFAHVPPKSLSDPNLIKYLTVMLAGDISSVLFYQHDTNEGCDRARCIEKLLSLGADDERIQQAMTAARAQAVSLVRKLRATIERIAALLRTCGALSQLQIDAVLLGEAEQVEALEIVSASDRETPTTATAVSVSP